MNFNEFKQLVIAECASQGIGEYELYYQAGSNTSVDTFQHQINEFSSALAGGVCFRCIVNGKMGYASTEALNAEQAKAVVQKAADNAAVLEAEEAVFLGEGGQEYEPLEDRSYQLPTTEELIAKVLETTEKLYAADAMAVDGCQTQGIVETGEMAIYNSKGLDLHRSYSASGLVVVGVVSDGKENTGRFRTYREMLGMDTDSAYYCAGLLLMNLDLMRKEGIPEKLFENTRKFADRLSWYDQDIINLVCGGRIVELDKTWNCTDKYSPFRKDVRQWHFQGFTRHPWCNLWKNITWMPYLKYLLKSPYRKNAFAFVWAHIKGFFWFSYAKKGVRRRLCCGILVYRKKVS